jgi:hypothetical protein
MTAATIYEKVRAAWTAGRFTFNKNTLNSPAITALLEACFTDAAFSLQDCSEPVLRHPGTGFSQY